MQSFTIATSKCWLTYFRTQLDSALSTEQPVSTKVKAILQVTNAFFTNRWPLILELLK